eukprot:6454048-Amphidinium_carterae.1
MRVIVCYVAATNLCAGSEKHGLGIHIAKLWHVSSKQLLAGVGFEIVSTLFICKFGPGVPKICLAGYPCHDRVLLPIECTLMLSLLQ